MLALVAGLAAVLTIVSSASAARGLITGIGDEGYVFASTEQVRSTLFDETVEANAGMVRLYANWRTIAGGSPPASPGDPADPSYDFSALDAAVVDAKKRGLDVVLMILTAPDWAEGPNRPGDLVKYPPGSWKPDPGKLAAFSRALAIRYSGTFAGPGGPLPLVSNYQVFSGGPTGTSIHADDATIGDLDKLHAVLNAAERHHTLGTRGSHALWATEFWWQSQPPNRGGVPEAKHARWYEQALYELWRQGVKVAMILQVRDPTADDELGILQSGLFFADGSPKLALNAFPSSSTAGRAVAAWHGAAPPLRARS